MLNKEMLEKIENGSGFIAALDQSGGSTPKALKGFGIDEGAYSSEEEMFALIHTMRQRIITAPSFAKGKILGAILFERTMDGEVGGAPVPTALWEKGIVPFLKVDKGLEDEVEGVQMMKPMPTLGDLLARARDKNIFGTKMRSVINRAYPGAIRRIVEQQFAIGNQIIDAGLVPILEPEVSIKAADRAQSDEILAEEIAQSLDELGEGRRVMLKLSIPAEAGKFDRLIAHPNVIRVVALSGGFSREEACHELIKNKGVIASFSRALLQDLRHMMSDDEFDTALGRAIDQIYNSSVT